MDFTIIWDICPELPFLRQLVPIRYYSLLFTTGLIIAYFLVRHLYIKENLSLSHLDDLTLYIFLGIVIGARLGHCLFYEPAYYLDHPLEILLPIKLNGHGFTFIGYRGLASHGGTIGVFLAIIIYARQYKTAIFPILDKIALVAPLVSVFIRVGNFMNSEILGIPTNDNYGVIFQNIDTIPRHPAQLYEAFFYLLIFFGLWRFQQKKRRMLNAGTIFGLLLISIFSIRFCIEFIKINQVPFEEGMWLNMGQLLSLPMIGLGIFILVKKSYFDIKSK